MPRLITHAKKQAEGVPLRLEDLQGSEVTIDGVRWSSGNFGPYCVMDCTTPDGESIDVMTSAMLVMDALAECEAAEGFPVQAKFARRGRTWIIE